MPNIQTLQSTLHYLPAQNLRALKQLFWSELNYDRANDTLPTRGWADGTREHLAELPLLLATAGQGNGFHIIYCRLTEKTLRVTDERPVIDQLLREGHTFGLFVFTSVDYAQWHFVNLKYTQQEEGRAQRVARRITVGVGERLRTATERLALLDVAALSPTGMGLSPLIIQQKHDEAFDVEAVTKVFFHDYGQIFKETESKITGFENDADKRLFTQGLFNRLLFLRFLERKGWLQFNGEGEYLQALRRAHTAEVQTGQPQNFYRDRLKTLFFTGLNTPNDVNIVGIGQGFLQTRIGNVPYLNGGLFEENRLDKVDGVQVPDDVLFAAFDQLLYHYNFTVTESTPLEVEVAVDPEMLGKIFEELVTGRHESGSYYTPKPVVAFKCREALKGYLGTECPRETADALANFVDQRNPGGLKNPETVLAALRRVRTCDPACGSGAYLLGMLHELMDLRAVLFAVKGIDASTNYQRKLEIIQRNLYGVDIDPFAVNIARLRLWLSLIVDFEGKTPPPLPNLDFKIEVGDSLTSPDPTGGLQPGLQWPQVQELLRLKEEYLTSHTSRKVELKKQIDELSGRIKAWVHPRGKSEGFDWLVEFAEVFTEERISATLPGKMAGIVNRVPGQMELAPVDAVQGGKGTGFDIVVANPPYIRADPQFKHIENEDERQLEINRWKDYREKLKNSKIYKTLYEKWDLYIPFLERAYQLICKGGQMVFIIPDSYNSAKYTQKSHEFFLGNSTIERIDFCSEIPLFNAGVFNTIVHFSKNAPLQEHIPFRYRRYGEHPDDFETGLQCLITKTQKFFGEEIFRINKQARQDLAIETVQLQMICYISVGMVINANEKEHLGEFTADDVVSDTQSDVYSKRFVFGKDVFKWGLRNLRYLEWGTVRSPSHFRRPTFPELHSAKEKLIAVRTPGKCPKVAYDNDSLFFDASSVGYISWSSLEKVINNSLSKSAKYLTQSPEGDREDREKLSRRFDLKYVLAILNSTFACNWLQNKRRSDKHIYPDDWKDLPIAMIDQTEQEKFVELVDKILSEYKKYGYPMHQESAQKVSQWEAEIDARVAKLYGVSLPAAS